MFIDDLPMYGYVGEVSAGTSIVLHVYPTLSASRKQRQEMNEILDFYQFTLAAGWR